MNREDFLRTAERFPEALLLASDSGQILACNAACLELLLQPEPALLGQNLFDWSTSPPERIHSALRLWTGSGRMILGPVRFDRFPGVPVLRCEGAASAPPAPDIPTTLLLRLKRQAAATERFQWLNRQITDLHREIQARHAAEAAIHREREWFRVTLSSIGDAVITSDIEGKITFLNPVAERITGWAWEDARGQPMATVFDIINEHSREKVENPTEHVLREGITVGLANHTILRARDGSERPIEDSAAPIRDSEGRLIGVVLVFHDVSEQYRARLEVERARDTALAASKAKDDFLAVLSHELRTPLNPVLMLASEAAADKRLPTEVRDDFATIVKHISIEARLIDDLLDHTRIARGKVSLNRQPVDVAAVLREALAITAPDLRAKQARLNVAIADGSAPILGDPDRLRQVFWNVLRNAGHFIDPGGSIHVRLWIDHAANELVTEIADSGAGMSPEDIKRVFEAFYQAKTAVTGSDRFGSLGLGLTISHDLITLHSGRIEAASDGPGRGSTFTIRLPTITTPSPPQLPASAPRSPPAAIMPGAPVAKSPSQLLLVEDHEPTRKVLARLLVRRGYEVTSCATATDALAATHQKAFDFVVSDIGLPDGNGFQLMQTLRDRYNLTGIALTGFGAEDDIRRSRESGFLVHLTKPVDIQKLDAALQHLHLQLPKDK